MSEQPSNELPDAPMSGRADTWPISAREAAALLGVNERTVRRAIARGEIHATKRAGAFRITSEELDRYRTRREHPNFSVLAPRAVTPHLVLMPAPRASTAPLPRPLTSFVGRESEIAAIRRILDRDDVRLVTLTGPGGVGKTRLAIAVAGTTQAFPDGVHFIGLAAVRDVDRVEDAIANALGHRSRASRPLADRLGPALSDKRILLVLDNFEHLLGAASLVTDLLTAFPELAILATSRTRLRLSGEHEYIVPPLQIDPQPHDRDGAAGTSEAARLFLARAEASGTALPSIPSTIATIERICQRLEGLPLAIELAANRLKVIPADALLERLERRMPLLTGGGRELPTRQQTMHATIDWSYNLLSAPGQVLFRRLSVFAGGVSLMAAEDCARSLSSDAPEPLDQIGELVDASLLREVSSSYGQPRYLMLETIREYGLAMLDRHDETRAARDGHAAFFVGLNDWLEPNFSNPGTSLDDRLKEIDAEQPNIDVALQHLAHIGDANGELHLAANCAVAWHHLGYLPEGRHWLEHALANAPSTPTLDRGMALAGLALIRWTQVDLSLETAEAEEALTIGRAFGNARLIALGLHMLGLIELLHEQYTKAWDRGQEAVAAWRDVGERSSEAMALMILSDASFGLGDLATSRQMADEALAIFRSIGHSPGKAFCSIRYAHILEAQGNPADALRLFQDALRLLQDVRERWAIGRPLIGVAGVATRFGQLEGAATLAGAIDARIEETGSGVFPQDRELYGLISLQVRTALGEERYAELHAAGRKMDMADVLNTADSIIVPGDRRSKPGAQALSPRERDVLALLAEGHSNSEIADALFISVRTVRSHVESILAKLGVPSRTAAAAHALRNHLL